jgi:hypothetical protein
VRFRLDDPLGKRPPHQVEGVVPWDFGATVGGRPQPFDTRDLADGLHTISAEIVLADGTHRIVHARFLVDN